MARLLLISLALGGCTFNVHGLDVGDGGVQPDLSTDGGPAQQCDPAGSNNSCSADGLMLLICRADGTGFNTMACPVACAAPMGAAPHCGGLVPAGAVQQSDYQQSGLKMVSLASNTLFDADSGTVMGALNRPAGAGVDATSGIGWREAAQPGAPNGTPKLGIFSFAGLTIAPGAVATVTGNDAVAFVSAKDVNVGGRITLAGDCTMGGAGPGGFQGGSAGDANGGKGAGPGGGSAGTGGGMWLGGGGGGGFGDIGGAGGGGSGAQPGAGGPIIDFVEGIFVGGSGGGVGAGDNGAGKGGGGGGALLLSVNGALSIGGTIDSGGCGGSGGDNGGGAGGGAGGRIHLEAVSIMLANASVLVVNGGGGGGGNQTSAIGQPGQASPTAANGGPQSSSGSAGGKGGAHVPALAGASGAGVSGNRHLAGGGGAGVGRILLRTRTGRIVDNGTVWSPDPSDLNTANKSPTQFGAANFN